MPHGFFSEVGQTDPRPQNGSHRNTACLSQPPATVAHPIVDPCTPSCLLSLDAEMARSTTSALLARLRDLAIPLLARMYRPDERLFVFRVRPRKDGIAAEGVSWRHTAISVLGLAGEDREVVRAVLGEDTLLNVCGHLVGDVPRISNLGDIALILWATWAGGCTERRWVWERLLDLQPADRSYPTVHIAWALSALCHDADAPVGDLRERLARRLLSGFNSDSFMFPHTLGNNGNSSRWHVVCFPDLIYSVLALTHYFTLTGDRLAIESAYRCAMRFCGLQGITGQWWSYYDWRTGSVLEPYPIYAVHQYAMAPMALLALQKATGYDFSVAIRRGLWWIISPPELGGNSLTDDKVGIIWQKVSRLEKGMVCWRFQALASILHPRLRVPGIDCMLPPRCIDYEDRRPSNLGWLLYTWPTERVSSWTDVKRKL